MNTPSPLIPQGTIPAKGKVIFFFKVVMILAVHVVLIGGMLLQGCKDTNKDNASNPPADTTVSSADTSNLPPVTNGGMSNAVTAMPSNPGPVAPSIPMQPGPTVQCGHATCAAHGAAASAGRDADSDTGAD